MRAIMEFPLLRLSLLLARLICMLHLFISISFCMNSEHICSCIEKHIDVFFWFLHHEVDVYLYFCCLFYFLGYFWIKKWCFVFYEDSIHNIDVDEVCCFKFL